jgi:cation transport ATPase
MVVGFGIVLGVAFAISTVRPELTFWAYGAAALAGLVPVTRRALAGAMSGTPFSIETLMTVAAAGAIAIGAAEEAAVVLSSLRPVSFSKPWQQGARRRHQGAYRSRAAHRPRRRRGAGAEDAGRALPCR